MANTNVVKLPTAAKRKVRQCFSRTSAADRKALVQFPMDKAIERKAFNENVLDDARAMMEADKAAAMQIALAVFSLLSNNDRMKAVGRLAGLAMLNHAGANSALAWISYEMSSTERRKELFRAADWLSANGEIQ